MQLEVVEPRIVLHIESSRLGLEIHRVWLLVEPPGTHHGMFGHGGLSEAMGGGGLDGRNIPSGVLPLSRHLAH